MDERTEVKVKALMQKSFEHLKNGDEKKARALVDEVIDEIGYVPDE